MSAKAVTALATAIVMLVVWRTDIQRDYEDVKVFA